MAGYTLYPGNKDRISVLSYFSKFSSLAKELFSG